MSWKASAYVKELITCPNGERITISEKVLLYTLADYHNAERNIAWPSVERLAELSLVSVRQAQRILQSLEDKRVISRDRGNGRGNLSRYQFINLPGECDQKKGDTMAPFSPEERVPPDAERVTSEAIKGDIPGPHIRKNHRTIEPTPPPNGGSQALTKKEPNYSEEFLKFWQSYPRKVGKGKAWEVWRRKVERPQETLKAILANLIWQARSDQWTRDEGQYIPHPSTYLGQRRWEDSPARAAPPPRSSVTRSSALTPDQRKQYAEFHARQFGPIRKSEGEPRTRDAEQPRSGAGPAGIDPTRQPST